MNLKGGTDAKSLQSPPQSPQDAVGIGNVALLGTPRGRRPEDPTGGGEPAWPAAQRLHPTPFVLLAAIVALVLASFVSLDLQWRAFASLDALRSMGRFLAEFFPPDVSPPFLRKLALASAETLAMSALGTLIAVAGGLLLALPASQRPSAADGWVRWREAQDLHGPLRRRLPGSALMRITTRLLLNTLRAVPDLVWAALLLVAAGLGPLAGTLALALHTTGVLGRLFAEAIENAPPGPAFALRTQGNSAVRVFLYATAPQIVPQLLSYTLYRWENNIRAAAVMGVVGAGGLGQLLAFHMGLFHMGKTASVLLAMLTLVALVDALSFASRRALTR